MDLVVRLAERRTGGILRALGKRGYFARDIVRGVRDPGTWVPETIRQMRTMGVESVPLTIIVAAFLGGVTAFQTRYQLFPGVQLSVVGLITRQSIVLELGPLLTALVLTGRVGARMTAEIGTMRVTEQIDALETLSFDPVAYLALPRFLAGIVMLPALVILANATAIASAWAILVTATDVRTDDFLAGLRLAFTAFQVVYSLIKAFLFGAAISFVCSYEGYVTEAGAEGVGRSTALAVVIASVCILVLDALVAAVLAPFIQA
ncbi:MlaE family ABC transporter permease [Gemmatimonas groenlandica]|uniref:ABC transporter permease n=1 Tax=Gemmatimonas groenlandica TaxID=2732249 RepID=A0A6M4IPQ2_9BACT|nr:ABC transporter permease [Gemmatimonas groenlandica]QJR34251.1 ABC transporter permease [Gemmatimonas groenlandica]